MFSVYKHTSPNGKVYIGITSKKPKERWQNGKGYANNRYFSRAIRKFGWDNFKHEILYEGLSEEQANIIEQMQINYYDSTNRKKGYNISIGGGVMTGRKHTSETRRKMSEKAKGRKVWCEGRKLTPEHIQHLREAHTGLKQSPEQIAKRAEKLKGHWVNTEPLKKSVSQYTLDGKYIQTFESITEAVKHLGLSNYDIAHISECCKGKRKTCKGFKWKYNERREK